MERVTVCCVSAAIFSYCRVSWIVCWWRWLFVPPRYCGLTSTVLSPVCHISRWVYHLWHYWENLRVFYKGKTNVRIKWKFYYWFRSHLYFILAINKQTCTFIFRELFGEGLQWAGCTLITLLGQQRRFEVLDFCYHILNVHKVDGKTDVVKGMVSTFNSGWNLSDKYLCWVLGNTAHCDELWLSQ